MATNVGRVEASIVPDISGFASQADAALTPVMERLGRKLGETLSRSMTRALDFSGVNTGLQRALDRAEAQAAGSGRRIGRGFARAVRAEISTELRNMPEARVQLSLDRASLAEYRARMAELTRPQTITVNVRTDSDQSGLLDFRRAADDASGAASRASSAIGSSGGGGGLSGALMGVGVAAGITALPAIGALVPMMAGAALGAGTLKLAFSGVGDALVLAGQDQKKYQEALKGLSPEQRAFTKAVVGLKKEFAPIGREVQKAMLPAFTKAVKAADPIVRILGDAMTDMADVFGDAADGVTRLMKDSGFQADFAKNLKLGTGFVRDMTHSLGPFVRSLLDFGAASGPTLKAFSDGIGGLLSKGLPGFFQGLKGGIKGSADMFTGLFNALKKVLPALGELVGNIADSVGPALKEIFESAGDNGTKAFSALGTAVHYLKPVFGEVGGAARIVSIVFGQVADIAGNVAKVVMESLWPSFRKADDAVGPLQRLASWLKDNKQATTEFTRQASSAIISFVGVVIKNVPHVIQVFRLMATGVLTALDGIISGAAKAFGWIPGIGGKLKQANKDFDTFKNAFITGLHSAEQKSQAFADKVGPRLAANKLKMNIDNWNQQIAAAKAKLSTVPPEKQAALKAQITDLQAKVRQAKRDIDSVTGKTVTIYSKYVSVGPQPGTGTVLKAQGGPISGPGTGTSDSIPAMLSNGEYVVRAKSVAKYGMAFLNSVNQGSLGISRLASGGLAGSEVANGLASGMTNSASKVNDAARVMASAVEAGVRTELQIASPSKKMQALAKEIGAGLIKGLTGSRDQIKSASAALAKDIWATFSGSTDNRLAVMLGQQTKKLLELAAKRDKVASVLAAGQQMAKDQKAAGLSFASVTSLPNGGNTFDAGGILSGLNVRLGQLKSFSANISKLAKMGLSKALIGQLIASGPDGGAAYAAALVKATPDQLKALNSTQAQIAKVSSSYGNSAADIMYDAGSQAGKGFLTGLKAQQKSIEDSMSSLAKAIQAAIKKALKIKSPSRVMADIGVNVAKGLVMGIDATHAAVVSSANRMAVAVQHGVQIEPASRAGQVRDVIFNANVTDKPTRQMVLDATRDHNALYGAQIVY